MLALGGLLAVLLAALGLWAAGQVDGDPKPARTTVDLAAATATLQAVVPYVESYLADNSSYTGLGAEVLRLDYHARIPANVTLSSTQDTYCIEYAGEISYHGPGGEIVQEPC